MNRVGSRVRLTHLVVKGKNMTVRYQSTSVRGGMNNVKSRLARVGIAEWNHGH